MVVFCRRAGCFGGVGGGGESRKTPAAAEPLFAVEEDVEAVWEAGYPGLEMPFEPVPEMEDER